MSPAETLALVAALTSAALLVVWGGASWWVARSLPRERKALRVIPGGKRP